MLIIYKLINVELRGDSWTTCTEIAVTFISQDAKDKWVKRLPEIVYQRQKVWYRILMYNDGIMTLEKLFSFDYDRNNGFKVKNQKSICMWVNWRRKWQPTSVFLLRNPMDRRAWWAIVTVLQKSQTWLTN